jgi:hypothetical protein
LYGLFIALFKTTGAIVVGATPFEGIKITLVRPSNDLIDRTGHAQIQPMAAPLRANSNNHKWSL